MTHVLLIDNYDSFTWNLVQAFQMCGARVTVKRNDTMSVADAAALRPTHLCISPGPGNPSSAGISVDMVRHFTGEIPILGVCLGHQAIVEAFGGKVVRAPRPIHGKASDVSHDGAGVFNGLPSPFAAGRYHSLVAQGDQLPAALVVSARAADGQIMGVRHIEHSIEGVQFHPESILTPNGQQLLASFLLLGHALEALPVGASSHALS